MKTILLGIWLTCGADATTTHYALNHGGKEIVMPTQNPYIIDGIVTGEAAGLSLGITRLNKTHPKLAKVIGVSMIVVREFVVASNIRQLRKR